MPATTVVAQSHSSSGSRDITDRHAHRIGERPPASDVEDCATAASASPSHPIFTHSFASPARCEVDHHDDAAALAAADAAPLISPEYIQQVWLLRAAKHTVLAPLERVKYVMQCQKELQRAGMLSCEFKTVWSCVRYLRCMEGVRSFWRGNMVQAISMLPILLANIFLAYPTQSFIFNSCPVHSAAGYTIASYAALLGGAVAAMSVSYPLEFARFRLAVDVKPHIGGHYRFRNSYAFFSYPSLSECPHFLYRGASLLIFGSIAYHAVHSTLLGIITPLLPPDTGDRGWTPAVIQTVCGLSVAGSATVVLHPVDLVRHRMMVAVMEDRLRYSSTMECILHIAQQEGVRGFFRGGTVTLTKMIAAAALTLVGLP